MTNKKGFTLVELVVVIAALGVIMTTVTVILVNSFRAKNRVESLTELDQNGDVLINSLKANVFNSTGVGMTCQTDPAGLGTTLTLTNTNNGEVTNLVCYQNNRIASESAKGNVLLTIPFYLPDCTNFARCETMPDSGQISRVNFNVILTRGTSGTDVTETAVSKSFSSTVTVRN